MANLIKKYKDMVNTYTTFSENFQIPICKFLFFQGYTRFQLKLGGDYLEDIQRIRTCHAVLSKDDVLIGDANTGRTLFRKKEAYSY